MRTVRARYVLAGLSGLALLLASLPAAQADYPEALESRLRGQLSRVLSGSDRALSFRACLLTPEEALVEVTVERGTDGDTARDALALSRARSQVMELVRSRFAGLALSSLSSFRLGGRSGPQPELFALRSER